jgi:gluconolactonase
MTQGEAPHGKYVVVDITGTYNKPIGPPILRKSEPAPGYRMVGVIFSKTGGGDYFFKMTGPKKTVGTVAERLRGTFGGDAAKETSYEF